MLIRPARADEAPALTRLAWLAKGHWGYGRQVMEGWRDDLRLTPDAITREPTWVVDSPHPDEGPVAVVQIDTRCDPWEIACLWVHPDHIGKGVGRQLMQRAIEHARRHRRKRMAIDADPHAEGFYVALGAVRVGELLAPLPGAPGRTRPQLLLQIQ